MKELMREIQSHPDLRGALKGAKTLLEEKRYGGRALLFTGVKFVGKAPDYAGAIRNILNEKFGAHGFFKISADPGARMLRVSFNAEEAYGYLEGLKSAIKLSNELSGLLPIASRNKGAIEKLRKNAGDAISKHNQQMDNLRKNTKVAGGEIQLQPARNLSFGNVVKAARAAKKGARGAQGKMNALLTFLRENTLEGRSK